MTHPHSAGWIGPAISLAVIAVVLPLRWRRMGVARPLNPSRLWLMPALVSVAVVALFVSAPPSGGVWLACVGALAVGGALGGQRGKTMRITVDPATGTLTQATSPAALIFIALLVVIKTGGREVVESGVFGATDPATLTDPLIVFGLGLVTMQRIEMWLRARRLRADHPSGGAAA